MVGDFDPAEVKKAAGELFGTWKSPAQYERIKSGFQKIAPINETIETPDKANAMFRGSVPTQLERQRSRLRCGGVRQLHAGRRLPEFAPGHSHPREGRSELRSRFEALGKIDEKDGNFRVYAIAAPQNVAKVETAFKEELDRALKDGFTQKEIDADRTGWLQSRQVTRAQDASLANVLARA